MTYNFFLREISLQRIEHLLDCRSTATWDMACERKRRRAIAAWPRIMYLTGNTSAQYQSVARRWRKEGNPPIHLDLLYSAS